MTESVPARYTYMWEYVVRPDRVDEFERLYGPNGEWSELFRESAAYIQTELHRDRRQPNRYVTVDHWESYDAWRDWRSRFDARFEELDRRGEQLTVEEREIGRFHRITGD